MVKTFMNLFVQSFVYVVQQVVIIIHVQSINDNVQIIMQVDEDESLSQK